MTVRIAITPGEPAGIGPDLTLAIAQQQWQVQLVVFADQKMLEQRAKQLQLPITLLYIVMMAWATCQLLLGSSSPEP